MMLTDDGARLDFSTFHIKAPETTGACTTDYFQATNAATGENINWKHPSNISVSIVPNSIPLCAQAPPWLTASCCRRCAASTRALTSTSRPGPGWAARPACTPSPPPPPPGGSRSLSLPLSLPLSSCVQVSQVLCSSPVLPPGGCLQYHTGLAGQVRSFNFLAATYNHLADQYYKVSLQQWEVWWLVTLQHCRCASGGSRATAASPGTPALTRTPSRSAAPPPTTTRGRGWPPAARTTCSYQVAGDNMDISTI